MQAGVGRHASKSVVMTRHGGPAALALALVLLGSLAQIVAARRVSPDAAPRPTSATVVNIVAPAGVLFITAAVGYLRLAGGPHAASSRVTNVLIAAALFASAAYTTVVTLIALAVAVAHNGLRRVWPSVWVVTAASVTCVAFLPMVLHQ